MAPTQHRLTFEAYGVAAEVVSDDLELFRCLPLVLPPGWHPMHGPVTIRIGLSATGVVTLDGVEYARVGDDRAAQLSLVGSALRDHFAVHAAAHVFVHTGVVGWRGAAILIPGKSFSGKTTLVQALLDAGATYYSDEYAVVDAEGLIHAFAKPLSVRLPGSGHLGVLKPVPDAQVGAHPIRAGLIALTRFEPGAEWAPEVCEPGAAALALLEHTIGVRAKPAETLATARMLAQTCLTIVGPRGEANQVAGALLELAEARLSSAR